MALENMRAVELKNPLAIIRPSARFPIVINTAANNSTARFYYFNLKFAFPKFLQTCQNCLLSKCSCVESRNCRRSEEDRERKRRRRRPRQARSWHRRRFESAWKAARRLNWRARWRGWLCLEHKFKLLIFKREELTYHKVVQNGLQERTGGRKRSAWWNTSFSRMKIQLQPKSRSPLSQLCTSEFANQK